MKLALQVVSWIGVIIGALAILGGVTSTDLDGMAYIDWYAVVGGALFFLQGVLALAYLKYGE